MQNASAGPITFLFTDIEGSTQLWERYREQMRVALAQHDHLLRDLIEAHGGDAFKTVGDAFCAAFSNPMDAVRTAIAVQQALQAAAWPETGPLWVRMALHTGIAEYRDADYFGPALNRVARLLSASHGGQIVLSAAVVEVMAAELPPGATLADLGEHRLKDLDRAIRIYQLGAPGLRTDFPALRTLEGRPNNLPLQVTRFVGRERELAEVKAALINTRLLTVQGMGGMGKTRLSLQAAAEVIDQYADGVWLVELAPLTDPSLVPQAVADALGVREEPGEGALGTLTSFLKAKQLLIVLDNCEHLESAAVGLVQAILRSTRDVRILATSRTALNVAGEIAWPMPPLSVPAARERDEVDTVLTFESVALFIDRAMAVRPSFAVTAGNAAAVAGICRRLDGVALAIELAAARVRMLTPEQILARLDDRFHLLTGGERRAAVPHHQTLRAAIDWSYDLLGDDERRLLQNLTVFRGGWPLEAAEIVGAAGSDEAWRVLDLLGSLVDKSLIMADDLGASVRYRMLETIREYGREKLALAGGASAVAERHADWCLALTTEAAGALTGRQQGEWLQRLAAEHENLRAALDWYEGREADSRRMLDMVHTLHTFWQYQGYLSEGRRWIIRALALPANAGPVPARARALVAAARLGFRLGHLDEAQKQLRESIGISRSTSDRRGEAEALREIGKILDLQGDYTGATAAYREALASWQELDDSWGIAATTNNLALVARRQGDLPTARAYLTQCLGCFQQLGTDWEIAVTRANLADISLDLGDVLAAEENYAESLAIDRRLGDREGIAYALEGLANVARMRGDYATAWHALAESLVELTETEARLEIADWLDSAVQLAAESDQPLLAARLLGAAEALREELAAPATAAIQAALAKAERRMHEAMDDDAFNAARTQGRNAGWQEVTAAIPELMRRQA